MKFQTWSILVCLLLLGCPYPSDPKTLPGHQEAIAASSSACVESGIAVAVVIDTSGSMAGSKLSSVKTILRDTIAPRFRVYQAKGNQLELSLIECEGYSPKIPIFHSAYNHDNFLNCVNSFGAGGGTPLGEAVHAAYVQLAKSKIREQHIFILSDGQASGLDPEQVLSELTNKTVILHVVGFQSEAAYYQAFVKHGAQLLMTENASQLDTTCDSIFQGILKVEAE